MLSFLYWKNPRLYIWFCIRLVSFALKCLRVRRDKLRGKNIHEGPSTSCYALLSLAAPTFLLLEIKSQNCYLRNFLKSVDILRPLSLLKPTPIHPHWWHKNKRLLFFLDNLSDTKIIHVTHTTQVKAFRQRLRYNDQYQRI